MNPAEQNTANEIRAALARQGIVAGDDDIAAIVKTNRAGLARALAAVSGAGPAPEVPQGFIPPAPPADAVPRPGR
jgi:hypothetical protein